MRARVGQRPDELVEVIEGARPAVGEYERKGIRALPRRVNVVQAKSVDFAQVVVVAVEGGLLRPPVEPIRPIRAEILQIGVVRAVGPTGVRHQVRRPACPFETLAQIRQRRVRDFDREWCCRHIALFTRLILVLHAIAPDSATGPPFGRTLPARAARRDSGIRT